MGRELRKQIELDATPEQVWEAVATGPGIATWFVPSAVEPHVGGTVAQEFGGQLTATGTVTAYEPGRRFAYEGPETDGPRYAFEFLVEGRDGGSTVLTFVQSGFLDGADWDGEYDGFDKGWDLFLGNLRSALAHFPSRPAQTVVAVVSTAGSRDEAWPPLLRALGLAGMPALGDEVTLAGPQPVTGVVDVTTPEFLGVRSAEALHRIGAEGDDGCGVSAYHYFYGAPIDRAAVTAAWQGWLDGLFPQPART
ncbi:SRPBCC family protein [Pseudonocardia sp. CA-107938]|uniref:SRPBCC family protein n=1 Tax=Pseudonocardia sp. CA-107938 TaxID=3240021 RepID=UPI003D927185